MFKKTLFFLFFPLTLCSGCIEEDIYVEVVNVPVFNEETQLFEDQLQEFPCGSF